MILRVTFEEKCELLGTHFRLSLKLAQIQMDKILIYARFEVWFSAVKLSNF